MLGREYMNLVFVVARDCLPARLLEAQMFMNDKEYEQAIAQTGRLLKSDGSNLEALHLRGLAHMYLYDFDMAKKHFGEILRCDVFQMLCILCGYARVCLGQFCVNLSS